MNILYYLKEEYEGHNAQLKRIPYRMFLELGWFLDGISKYHLCSCKKFC